MRCKFSNSLFVFSLLVLLAACNKTEETSFANPNPVNQSSNQIVAYKFPGYDPVISISAASKKIEVKFPATVRSGEGLIAEFSLSGSSKATIDGVEQVSTVTPNDFIKDKYYKVTAPGNPVNTWKVTATNNDRTYGWGLGHFTSEEISNNRGYEWYYDQGTTGVFSSINCGPSSATMAIKWADASFSRPPEYARNFYGTSGGWWLTYYINGYLNDNAIPNAVLSLGTTAGETWTKITRQLDQGRIVILCLNMHYISEAATGSVYRVDRFYHAGTGFGHFIVVKGYKEVDKKKYFEVYDPNNFGVKNADDQTFKGRGRYYRCNDIYTATSRWWNYAIAVNPKGVMIDPATLRSALDPATVPVAKGR